MVNKKDLLTLPNLISLIRILMAPVLLWLAWQQKPVLYMLAVLFTLFTDVVDGFLARLLNQLTDVGALLDSVGDFIIYSTLIVAAWWLWPDIIIDEIITILVIIASFTAPVIVGLLKFRTLTSYHTWSVKAAVFISILAYVVVFSDWARWPLYVAATVATLAAIEEIAITLVMRHAHANVQSVWHAFKHHREE